MKYLILLKMFSCSLFIFAQNLVPNGGFEMGTYNGGSNPIQYYSNENFGKFNNQRGLDYFDDDLNDSWYVVKPASSFKDSAVRGSFLERLFFVDSTKKHSHMVDLEVSTSINVGYNYYYHLNKVILFGFRSGFGTFKVEAPLHKGDRIVPSKIEVLGSIKLYRTIFFETGIGYSIFYNFSKALGNSNCNECGQETGNFIMRCGINMTLYNHFFIRSSLNFEYLKEIEKFSSIYGVSIGYKF